MGSATRKAIAAMRRNHRADLEHDLVTVAQAQLPRIDRAAQPVHVHTHAVAEAEQPLRAERLPPHREDAAERESALVGDDARRVGRPGSRSTARAGNPPKRKPRVADAYGGRNDHDASAREQLEVDAGAAVEWSGDAQTVHTRRRVVARPGADRRGHERKRSQERKHLGHAIPLAAALVAVLAGCGGGSGTKQGGITVQPAHEYQLEQLRIVHPTVGKPTVLSFRVIQPDGKPLTAFKQGAGPHTGVHLILIRRDLSTIVHRHPPIRPDGTFSEPITFTAPGPYRIVVDAYPAHAAQTNFQLFSTIDVAGAYKPQPLPPLQPTQTIDGYRFALQSVPHLRAIEPAFLRFTVTGPTGKPASFTPWYGALAHAIFFRRGSLDYFHTHVCAPGASACTSALGTTKITGTSATPGKLTVGVLVPLAGTWRLFLQCRVDGRVLTAPFTLVVR